MKTFDLRLPAIAAGVALASCLIAPATAQSVRPQPAKPFFALTHAEQQTHFPALEKAYPTSTIKKGEAPRALASADKQIAPSVSLSGRTSALGDFMAAHQIKGVVALKDGKVVLEHYAPGFSADTRWPSTGVAQALTSTLTGAAIRDRWIRNRYDSVRYYIPELEDTIFEEVSLNRLMAMASGARWNEAYRDSKSDVRKLADARHAPGKDHPVIAYAKQLKREAEPGAEHEYKTIDADLAGLALSRALAGKTLSDFASEKIWKPAGMEADALWMLDAAGHEKGSGPVSLTLRDAARFGQYILNGGKAGEKEYLPPNWVSEATSNQLNVGAKQSAALFWSLRDDGAFEANGLYGQGLHIDPKEGLVIAIASSAAQPNAPAQEAVRSALVNAIRKELGVGEAA